MLNLEIITPQSLFLSQKVEMVTIPAFAGEMGVLPGHASMIVAITPGLVKIYQGDTAIQSIFVYDGVAKIDQDNINMVIASAVNKTELNFTEARNKMHELELKLLNSDDSETQALLEKELSIYRKMVEIAEE